MSTIACGLTAVPSCARTCTAQPGTECVGEPGLYGSSSMPRQLEAIGQPVSVCHQWSTAGTFSLSWHHFRVRSEEHTSELQSLMRTSYAVFCLKKKSKLTIIKESPRRNRRLTKRLRTVMRRLHTRIRKTTYMPTMRFMHH